MKRLWVKIAGRIQLWFSRHFRNFTLKSVEEMPEENSIRSRVAYWVGAEGYKWCLAFICPCGCREVIYLNLLPNARPLWRVEKHKDDSFSISPSVNRVKRCKAHFFVKRGKVLWA
jgi:hypothetical protein